MSILDDFFTLMAERDQKHVSIDLQFLGGDQLEDCDQADLPIDRIMARYPETMDPLITAMLDARTEPIAGHAIHDRPVASTWVEHGFAILGDAAHSMRPNLGQGACQSIHDAAELVGQLTSRGLTHEALKAYEDVRKPYVTSIVEVAKKMAPDPKEMRGKG